jgi:excisionase family DNA binding protein
MTVYTPETLAERWGLSSRTIRRQIDRKEIAGFRVGKSYRIPASEVERIEGCHAHGQSEGSEDSSPSSGMQRESATVTVLEPQTRARLNGLRRSSMPR